MKIQDLPVSSRPCERCRAAGPGALTDAELLAMILRSGSADENSVELAERVLAMSPKSKGICGLLELTEAELLAVRGIGPVKALQLMCLGEISRRIWDGRTSSMHKAFTTPDAVADFYMEKLRHLGREELHIMLFDTKQKLIREAQISCGTVNASLIDPRDIFIEALRFQAVSLIMVHNHPSGDPTPSPDDRSVTRRVEKAGEMIGIRLMDHVIIGDQTYFSFRERGLIYGR